MAWFFETLVVAVTDNSFPGNRKVRVIHRYVYNEKRFRPTYSPPFSMTLDGKVVRPGIVALNNCGVQPRTLHVNHLPLLIGNNYETIP